VNTIPISNHPPLKILHLIDSSGIAGGERYLVDLISHSDPAFDHQVVLSHKGPLEDVMQGCHMGYDIVSMERKISIHSVRELRSLITAQHPDIVHTHGYRANFYGRLASLAMPVKHITTIHVSLYDYLDTPRAIRRMYLMAERVLSFKTSHYICISEAMKNDLLKMGIANEKITVVHNGVDLEVFYPRPIRESLYCELGIGDNRPVIGTVGRMVPEKGQKYLIEALVHLKETWPSLRCLFIGTGPLFGELQRYAADMRVEKHCVFTGVRLDIADIYPLLELFVLPSIREPFGLTLLEAMASRIPVIATNSGGPPDFIQNGYNGILVPPAHPKELASQIDFFLNHRDRAKEIAQHGYETAKNRYSIVKTVKYIEEIYRKII